MALTSDRASIRVAGTLLTIEGRSGIVSPTWTVTIDDREVARAKIGDRGTLDVPLPDGSHAEVEVDQGAFGPTTVVVRHGGEVMAELAGFLA